MNWTKQVIEKPKIIPLFMTYLNSIKTGDPTLEDIRCVFMLVDDELIYVRTLFDTLDMISQNKLALNRISQLFIYQPFNES